MQIVYILSNKDMFLISNNIGLRECINDDFIYFYDQNYIIFKKV